MSGPNWRGSDMTAGVYKSAAKAAWFVGRLRDEGVQCEVAQSPTGAWYGIRVSPPFPLPMWQINAMLDGWSRQWGRNGAKTNI